jgi:(S)-citramalyl-CoA lyase
MTLNPTNRPRRSVLFVSALALEGLAGAMNSGSDIVCVDLEDAVPPGRKEEGRIAVQAALPLIPRSEQVHLAARINSLRSLDGVADMLACLELGQTGLQALVLPKVETRDEVRWAGALADEAKARLDLYVIIETTEGLENCLQIAKSHPRLKALFFGGFDLSTALGCAMAWEPLLYARSRVVHAAASAGVDVLDSPFPEIDNPAGLRASAEQAKSLGMVGKAAKHASQIPAITEVFTPQSGEIERARRILELFAVDPAKPLVFEGKLIELPTIKRLRRVAEFGHAAQAARGVAKQRLL